MTPEEALKTIFDHFEENADHLANQGDLWQAYLLLRQKVLVQNMKLLHHNETNASCGGVIVEAGDLPSIAGCPGLLIRVDRDQLRRLNQSPVYRDCVVTINAPTL